VVGKVFFGTSITTGSFQDFTDGHIETEDKRLGAVAEVLELTPFNLSRSHGQTGVFPFQSLHTAQFIRADHSLTFLRQFRGLLIQAIYVLYFLVELLVSSWSQPVADQVGLEITLFLKASPHVWARFAPRCHAA
jgi:hypothetical protein